MKKILLTGIVILLAVFLVTCDALFPEEEEIEYTDVVYSKGGSEVTIYLDGAKVPVTKAQRAMSKGLAEMAYDYLEVIFLGDNTSGAVARSQWELGQSAGISGVDRSVTYTQAKAILAVGTKDGKTLLGIGSIIDPSDGKIVGDSVTFGLHSIQSGLKATTADLPAEAVTDSLKFTTGTVEELITTLGGEDYPMYSLSATDSAFEATYTFINAALSYLSEIKQDGPPIVQKRIPRYMQSGRYLIPKNKIDTKTTVAINGTVSTYSNVVPLKFTKTAGTTGIFSFYIDIPCFMLVNTKGSNGGEIPYIKWHIRSGFGSELYSLDDGVSSGGCVLVGSGVGALDWLGIEWEWEN